MPMSSPMMTTILGRCPAGAGIGCWACAGLVSPTAESAEAATRELPLNNRSRRFNPPPACPVLVSAFAETLSLLMACPHSGNAPEADMACRGVDRLGMTRGRTIAAAVVGSAEMRAAFKHLAWNPDIRLTRVVTRSLRSAAWILGNAARLRRIGLVLLRIPIGRPFPDVADHVVQAIAVGRKRCHRRCTIEAVRAKVLAWKFALPGVCHVLSAWRLLVAPCEFRAVKSAACGEFPFGLVRQFLPGPFGIGFGVPVGDVDDWVLVEPADVAARSARPAPVGAEFECPPLTPVAQVHGLLGRCEDKRAGPEHVRQSAWIVLRVGCNFGKSDVTSRVDEFGELAIGDRRAIHPELAHGNAVDGRFLWIVPIRAHSKRAARHVQHPDVVRRAFERWPAVERRYGVNEIHNQVLPFERPASLNSPN